MPRALLYTLRLAIRARGPGRSRFALRLQLLLVQEKPSTANSPAIAHSCTNAQYHDMQEILEISSNKNKMKFFLYTGLFNQVGFQGTVKIPRLEQ